MNKKILVLIAIFCVGIMILFAQSIYSQKVPKDVINSFNKNFPKAVDVEWTNQGDNYNVEFEIRSVDYDAWFDSFGRLLRYTREITVRELPENIRQSIYNNYKGCRIDEVKMSVKDGVEEYEVEIERLDSDIKLIYSKDGTLIREEM